MYGAPVNNAGIDPIQGFDFECWAQDTHTGQVAFFGRFQSLTVSIRDATETYLELGQRIPIYLNGEIQIAWVLEQGLVDMAFIVKTFGIENIRRDQVIARGPRFHIGFDANAADRVSDANQNVSPIRTNLQSNNGLRAFGADSRQNGLFNSERYKTVSGKLTDNAKYDEAQSQGRYEMMRCKVDSVSLGVMPGRRVAAVRWEGVSEGITYHLQSIQTFKNQLSGPGEGGVVARGEANSTFIARR
jgi:hypothetical protein